MMCRRLSIFLLVLLLASFSLWAFPGRQTGSQEEKLIDISVQEVSAEAQKPDSGTQEEITSTEPSISYLAQEKAEQGKRLSADEVSAILAELDAAKADYAALQRESDAKDAAIDDLSRDAGEAGTKAYLMLDGIIGFSGDYPAYGIGLTVGTRLGNSLMLELGADYMLGANMKEAMEYSLDKWTFRAGIGWMF